MFPNFMPSFDGLQPTIDFVGGFLQFVIAHPILTIGGGAFSFFISLGVFRTITDQSHKCSTWLLESSAAFVKFTCKLMAGGLKTLFWKGYLAAKDAVKKEEE